MSTPILVDQIEEVDSSAVSRVGWTLAHGEPNVANSTGAVYIEFHNGTVTSYKRYFNEYINLAHSASVGSHYNRYFKGSSGWVGTQYNSHLELNAPKPAPADFDVKAASVTSGTKSPGKSTFLIAAKVDGYVVIRVEADYAIDAIREGADSFDELVKGTWEIVEVKKG